MDDGIKRQAIALYDRFTHEGLPRREFMSRMVALAGSVAAAEALIGAIAASPAAAAIVPEGDTRLRTGGLSLANYPVYGAMPRKRSGKLPAVLVIHENRGLNAHIRDVTRRLALAGYFAVAPDLLAPAGGTPTNEDRARELINKLDLARSVRDATAMLDRLHRNSGGNGKVGVVGFCWGGGFVNRLAVAAGTKLDAGVAYYGPAPNPAEAPKVQAPLLLHYAGRDDRVNATGKPWVAALKAAGKPVDSFTYEGADHAFNNDTSAERYNKAAADLAWQRTLAFFKRYLS
ncbi:dienelactone hydrolase family protein [Sphingomonas sp. BN140010]|uniref:Dienelactone hydrolase family protein n=1 Tax=Sphingomonas arvum TaxID=2992113 RepID=A0ABT3JDE8_9SPHN|nr:dienelactone hydrolase family protein [Sphingomonas sp. BN140010]MCW3796939.1 dienelactone hydrolase family protein [Sphingomonas sp. BN140010]